MERDSGFMISKNIYFAFGTFLMLQQISFAALYCGSHLRESTEQVLIEIESELRSSKAQTLTRASSQAQAQALAHANLKGQLTLAKPKQVEAMIDFISDSSWKTVRQRFQNWEIHSVLLFLPGIPEKLYFTLDQSSQSYSAIRAESDGSKREYEKITGDEFSELAYEPYLLKAFLFIEKTFDIPITQTWKTSVGNLELVWTLLNQIGFHLDLQSEKLWNESSDPKLLKNRKIFFEFLKKLNKKNESVEFKANSAFLKSQTNETQQRIKQIFTRGKKRSDVTWNFKKLKNF